MRHLFFALARGNLHAPYTNALMQEISREVMAMQADYGLMWRKEADGEFSVAVFPGKSGQIAGDRTIASVVPDFPPDGEKQIRVGGAVQAARLQYSVPPVYPPLAMQARIQGTVRSPCKSQKMDELRQCD